jgi:hypothetical protein
MPGHRPACDDSNMNGLATCVAILPIKNDTEVTEADVRDKHLILFGDPGSNSWIAKALPHLPVSWTTQES